MEPNVIFLSAITDAFPNKKGNMTKRGPEGQKGVLAAIPIQNTCIPDICHIFCTGKIFGE